MLQSLADGLVGGSLLAVIGLGFWLPYAGAGVFHLALGASFILSPFVARAVVDAGMPTAIGVGAGLASGAILSGLCALWNHRRLAAREATWAAHLIASLGVYIIVSQAATLIWGNELHTLPMRTRSIELGPVLLGYTQVLSLGMALGSLLLFYWWLLGGKVGLRARALADSPQELELRGYSTERLRVLLFCLSGLAGSVFAIARSFDRGFDATGGLDAVFLGFAAVIVGGRESYFGPLLGGLLLGLVRSLAAAELGGRWVEPATYAVLALFLLLRPGGLLASQQRLEGQ